MSSTFGKIDAFDDTQESWEHYVERLGQYFLANDIDGEAGDKRRAILLSVCGSKVYKLMSDLLAPTKPSEKSYADLTTLVQEHFSPKPSEIVQRYKFHNRFRKQGESIAQFVASLRHLAEHCKFNATLETMIRDRLVCGINDDRIQRRLLSEKELTYARAYDIAISMETAAKNVLDLQTKDAPPSTTVNRVTQGPTKRTQRTPPVVDKGKPCFRCGGNHKPQLCSFKNSECFACKQRGHIAKKCPNSTHSYRRRYQSGNHGNHDKHTHANDKTFSQGSNKTFTRPKVNLVEVNEDHNEQDIYPLYSIGNQTPSPYQVDMILENQRISMEIDTGAARTVIGEDTFNKLLENNKNLKLTKTDVKLQSYTGEKIQVLGQCVVTVEYKQFCDNLPVLVIQGANPCLIGRDWFSRIKLNWQEIFSVKVQNSDLSVETCLAKHFNVFNSELGKVKGLKVKIHVDNGVKPLYYKSRPVPYMLRDKIEKELDRLVSEGTITQVDFSDWATPIVPIVKTDGSIRICGDYKVTVNRCSKLDNYPIPKMEDMYASLGECEEFSKLDLSQAYQQLELDDESKMYTTINTHRGLYQYNRLPYGIASAPGIFQRTIENILHNIPQVIVRIDDILVTGKDREKHLHNLEKVLTRLEQAGVHLKKEKCIFLAPEVIYLGHRINKTGIQPVEEKVRAIKDSPAPKNIKELQAFLGMINYYGCYLPNLSTILAPLHKLLTKGTKWIWGSRQEQSWKTAKDLLQSANVLVHYDPSKEIVLSCDASPYGLGAVISHIIDGQEKPIAYASRTLSPAEKNYAQLDKEGAAIVFGIRKFHQYLFGRRTFKVYTDHKPLVGLFKCDKAIPIMASPRIQRWALFLSGYSYDLVYREGKQNGNADGLSRLPLLDMTVNVPTPGETVLLINYLETSPVTSDEIAQWTLQDPVLKRVLNHVHTGWYEQGKHEQDLRPYYVRKHELSIFEGCLMWGNRIVIPHEGRSKLIDELHECHPGIVRMKQLARSYFWWPQIDTEIENRVKQCNECQLQSAVPATAPLHPWEWPTQPWSRIHIDYAGPFLNQMFLIIVDAYSKWLEVIPTQTSTTQVTIEKLRTVFATHGLPDMVVSDNGSCFTSDEFSNFMQQNGIRHVTTAPKHPSSNGLAERYVRIFKEGMKKNEKSGGSVNTRLSRFLLAYRSTPQTTTGLTPAELLLN